MRDSEREVMGDVAWMVGKFIIVFGLFILLGRAFVYFCGDDGCGLEWTYFIALPLVFGILYYVVYKAILDN